MEVFDAVRTALAVRELQDKPVPPDDARRIAEAARLSGSAANRQPWHFIAVDDRDPLCQLGGPAAPSNRWSSPRGRTALARTAARQGRRRCRGRS